MNKLELNDKQFLQLRNLCMEFQPFIPFESTIFLKFITMIRKYCITNGYSAVCTEYHDRVEKNLPKEIETFKTKYYFTGVKPNHQKITSQQTIELMNYTPRIYMSMFTKCDKYRPIEKVLFIKLVRACRDFLRAKLSKEAFPVFMEKFWEINNVLAD